MCLVIDGKFYTSSNMYVHSCAQCTGTMLIESGTLKSTSIYSQINEFKPTKWFMSMRKLNSANSLCLSRAVKSFRCLSLRIIYSSNSADYNRLCFKCSIGPALRLDILISASVKSNVSYNWASLGKELLPEKWWNVYRQRVVDRNIYTLNIWKRIINWLINL